MPIKLTRTQIEKCLEENLINRVISYQPPKGDVICGKVDRVGAEWFNGDIIVSVILTHRRIESDLSYFCDHTVIQNPNGNTQGTSRRSVRELLENYR